MFACNLYISPTAAVCTLLGLLHCCAMPSACTSYDDNVMPVFFSETNSCRKCQEIKNQNHLVIRSHLQMHLYQTPMTECEAKCGDHSF